MADPRLILGRIVAVSGPEVGPASSISYSIAVHDPVVEGVYRLERQRPVTRWPDDIDISAVQAGTIVIGTVSANRVQWHFHEYPAFAPCQSAAGDFMITPDQTARGVLRQPGGPVSPPASAPIPDVNPD